MDWRIVAAVVAVALGAFLLAAWVAYSQHDIKPLIFLVVSEVLTIGALLAITLPVRYELWEQKLVVRTGVIRSEIWFNSIEKIEPCSSIMAGPSLSFDRLRIEYDNNGYDAYVLVSPDDEESFLTQLEARRGALT